MGKDKKQRRRIYYIFCRNENLIDFIFLMALEGLKYS